MVYLWTFDCCQRDRVKETMYMFHSNSNFFNYIIVSSIHDSRAFLLKFSEGQILYAAGKSMGGGGLGVTIPALEKALLSGCQ